MNKSNRKKIGTILAAALIAATVSTGISTAAPVSKPRELDSLGSSSGSENQSSELVAEINIAERNEAGNILSVTWSIENTGSDRTTLTWLAGRSYLYSGANYAGVTATSADGTLRFHPIMDETGTCLCSGDNSSAFKEWVSAGEKISYWSMFSVPSDVESITVEIPGFEPIEDVPIS